MNLWLVDDTIYVIADGWAGTIYLSGGKKAVLIQKNFTKEFKPRILESLEIE